MPGHVPPPAGSGGEPPWSSAPPASVTPPGGRRRPSPATLALLLALGVSVLFNGILGIRLREAEDESARLRSEIAALNNGPRADGTLAPSPTLEEIAATVEEIRGLSFLEPVETEVVSPERLLERLIELGERQAPKERLRAGEDALRLLGLIDPDLDLVAAIETVREEQVSGFYDIEQGRLVVAGDPTHPSPLQRIVLAHEYTHALADQHFDLGRIDALQRDGKDDQAAALLALAEGDAELVARLYQEQTFSSADQQDFIRELLGIPRDRFDALPEPIQEALLFPYREGVTFVETLHEQGGFPLIDAAYRDPPRSTVEILEPDLFHDGPLEPVAVPLPDLAGRLGGGWRERDRAEFGALDLQLTVREFLPVTDADRSAREWRGGTSVLLADAERRLIVIAVVFSSDRAAVDALAVLERWVPMRFRNRGREIPLEEGEGRSRVWEAPDGRTAMAAGAGRRALLLVGPDPASVRAARAALGPLA